MLRRVLILLLVLLMPIQALAGSFAPLCVHGSGPAALRAEQAEAHAHCADAMAMADDHGAMADPAAADSTADSTADFAAHTPADAGCDDCGICHHVSFSLFLLPVVPDALAFTPVRVARERTPAASRVPPQPERPPRTAAA